MQIRRAVLQGKGDLRIEAYYLNEDLAPDQVLVETQISALSTGTDLGNYLGDSTYVPGAPDYPRPLGYSNVGIVTQIAPDVRHSAVGQRVFSMKPHVSAFVAGAQDMLVAVPDGVSSEQA